MFVYLSFLLTLVNLVSFHLTLVCLSLYLSFHS